MIKTKVAFSEGRLLSSQSEQSEKIKALIGWEKSGPPKNPFCFEHVNRPAFYRGFFSANPFFPFYGRKKFIQEKPAPTEVIMYTAYIVA